jgi:spermidine synthase
VLVACAAAGLMVGSRRTAGWLLLALGLPVIALLAAALHAVSSDASRLDVRASVETGEISVRVVDEGPIRRLLFPGDLVQSEQDLRRPGRLQLRYTHALHGATCRARTVGSVLMIGVGGGSLVRSLHAVAPDAHVDAVELHRPVLELARRWFGLPDGPWVDYHVDDARRFLAARAARRYDLIVLDAFGTETVPAHLLSLEFMALVRERLEPGGVLAANVIAAPGSELAEAVQATVTEAFGTAEVRAPVPPTGNLIWSAPAGRPRPGCEEDQAAALGLTAGAVRGATVDVARGRVLTDDRNPAEVLGRE